jgi:hypothetical protein
MGAELRDAGECPEELGILLVVVGVGEATTVEIVKRS